MDDNKEDKYDKKLKVLYKLRIIKIGWLNEQMYHKLLKKEKWVNVVIYIIQAIVFGINVIATAIGDDINYRWWTITTAVIAAFASYINKMKDDTAYGSKIELHKSMTDECMKFTDKADIITTDLDSIYNQLLEKSSKLHIEPDVYEAWELEFKNRGIKDINAFDLSNELSKELTTITVTPRDINPTATSTALQTKNNKANFELQMLFTNLNEKE